MQNFIIQHSRGNHSPEQVFNHGRVILEGTKKECRAKLIEIRKSLKIKYSVTSTNDKLTDFVKYEMGDIFFVSKQGEKITWA